MAVIGQIRNRLGWLLIAIIGLAIIAFLFMDLGGAAGQGQPTSNDLAVVNGEVIDYGAFSQRFDQNIQNAQLQSGQPVSDAQRNAIRNNTYNEILSETLFADVYENVGVAVSDKEKLSMMTGRNIHPSIQSSFADANGDFDAATFNQFIATLDIDDPGTEPGSKRSSWENFERYMIQDRYQSKYYSLVEGGLNVPTWMAEMQYSNENTLVNFDYVLLPYSDIETSTLGITDADLQSYIDANGKEFESDETVSLQFAFFPIEPSEQDYTTEYAWTQEKTAEWMASESDSLFIRLYSETPWDSKYYTRAEMTNKYADTLFNASLGATFGPDQNLNQYESVKLLDRKLIADSLQARHLLLSSENLVSQEEAIALNLLADSLFTLVDSMNVPLSSLTAEFSDDKANSFNGGDLGWVKKGQMVAPFEEAIFYQMDEGDVKIVYTEFGIHLVEVYNADQTIPAIQVATLTHSVYTSEETQRNLYSDASVFAGNNNTRDAFEAASDSMNIVEASGIAKDANNIPRLVGDARQLIKWAFTAEAGAVSAPTAVGNNYVVAMVDSKNEEGVVNLDAVRFQVEAAVANEKKAAQLQSKISGTDLNAIASSNGKTVAKASNISFTNTVVGSSKLNLISFNISPLDTS
ncbi:MAG: SurA N-terminal domain-containing protein [Chitinophagales bacterium]